MANDISPGQVFFTKVAESVTSEFVSSTWRNSAAITRLTVVPSSGNFIAGCAASLYAF